LRSPKRSLFQALPLGQDRPATWGTPTTAGPAAGFTETTMPPPRRSSLTSIACPDASSCMAVGYDSLAGPFSELWDGRVWKIVRTNPAATGPSSWLE
jgi:hypothetical protein